MHDTSIRKSTKTRCKAKHWKRRCYEGAMPGTTQCQNVSAKVVEIDTDGRKVQTILLGDSTGLALSQ